jgi:chemosensory pili system protein ChpA (sensor histidine kinase/response regulator)
MQQDDAVVIKDDLDADLLPVFLEEGQDILPQMEQLLRTWQQMPSDLSQAPSLLRHLHTVKGSARMAGAMELGQHMHLMETRIEQLMRLGVPSGELLEDLLSRFDIGLYMFDQLRDPDPNRPVPAGYGKAASADSAKPATADGAASVPALRTERSLAVAAEAGQLPGQPAAPVHQVRVRADVLDRLVNQAGEVSISRSKIETEVETLRGSLSEMTENVSRLRTQLREIEIQAESQMASQMAHAVDREFDPLEFDRFTRLQELTRSMAESVNDVASVQQNLLRTIDGATIDLTNQARLTRDLQQDLMRVRMVQFASISERLYRVTRQASKEVDKRVHLDIRGGNVEIDRSVLERMAGPFEHLLRNAIAHGIESRSARVAAGKSEIGELMVEIRQEGNEVVMQFTDDGGGLNLERIREKAKTVGLLTDGAKVSDAELQDMIFHPGFSTASEVTELAGRGIGMDVVRAEAAALGGRIAIESQAGKGARFMIRLPLTLAVTQVVLLSTGGKIYAVPSVLVEQVQQLKANALAAMYNDGGVFWQSTKVPIYYLSALLGDMGAAPIAQQYSPVVLLRSGNERVAIHVDQIIGSREVVVKNIGPQLARMLGIAGATVLGSGDIVLILNPAQLAHQALLEEMLRAPRILPSDAPEDMGAVAELEIEDADVTDSAPVQGLRTQQIVMVVDDSLTVRRVTQRLLSREGYQVVLAKDGVDALEQLQAITPTVMLVDIEMPRMDGFDLTRNVRDDERTRNIPIIMITSRTAAKHRNYALELGVNEYLGKPFQEEELLRHVANYASRAEPVA